MTTLNSPLIRPVILCGGAGTRLWPVSREHLPKQFLPLTGRQTLLQQTALRLSGDQFAPALVVSGESQRLLIEQQLREAKAPVEAVLLEPVARNTAAAAALAAAWTASAHGDQLLLLMPSDHVIGDRAAFLRAIEIGAPHALEGAIVTFGATPTEPNTQYGYIEVDPNATLSDGAFRIARFHEKPDARRAAEYLATGRFYWNCGIFLTKASTLLAEVNRFLPDSGPTIAAAVASATHEGPFVRPAADLFAAAENISIDNGIMEKTDLGVVVPISMDWSDVGAWDAVWKLADKDTNNNVRVGNTVAVDCRNSLLRSEGSAVIGALGLHDLAVVATEEAIFVAPLDRAADVKQLVMEVNADRPDLAKNLGRSATSSEPLTPILDGTTFSVTHLTLQPGASIRGDVEEQRRQWLLLEGEAEATLGSRSLPLSRGTLLDIPAGDVAELTNCGNSAVELIQTCFKD